jgi:hypothetical protein
MVEQNVAGDRIFETGHQRLAAPPQRFDFGTLFCDHGALQ